MALLSIITIDLVGIEKLSQAFGLVTMFMGIATMVASPIGGTYLYHVHSWHRDYKTFSYSTQLSSKFILPRNVKIYFLLA